MHLPLYAKTDECLKLPYCGSFPQEDKHMDCYKVKIKIKIIDSFVKTILSNQNIFTNPLVSK